MALIVRLQVYLARAGIATSRRKAESLIKEGKVSINGKVAKLGDKVDASKDKVTVEGHKLEVVKRKIYMMLNKPVDYIVSKADTRGRKLAYELLGGSSIHNEKLTTAELNSLFNVGRLDLNTEGLLLFTNDGEFALKLTHPRYGIKKVYIAKVSGKVSNEAVKKLQRGVWVKIRDGHKLESYKTKPATVRVLGRGAEFSVVVIRISEGRKREVRRMCEAVGYPVLTLKRIQIGDLELGDLPVGKWRYLSEDEVSRLRKLLFAKEKRQKEKFARKRKRF
jgi:23S rRNA pseudouridine2605 synthase